MAIINVNLDIVRERCENFVDLTSDCAACMNRINTDYIQETKNRWNSRDAEEYVRNVCAAFNDYIEQWNHSFSAVFREFQEKVNDLARSEHAQLLDVKDIVSLEELQVGWSGEDVNFRIDDEYGDFTDQHLNSNVRKILENLNEMNNCIDYAVQQALDSAFCNEIKASISKLISSADEVISQYNKETAAAASQKDIDTKRLEQNT